MTGLIRYGEDGLPQASTLGKYPEKNFFFKKLHHLFKYMHAIHTKL